MRLYGWEESVADPWVAWYRGLRTVVARASRPDAAVVAENNGAADDFQPAERFLQALWREQRFTLPLRTVDGRCLEVLHPGVWNVGAGPDFREARLRIDGQERGGAVEVHRCLKDWWRHGHDRDPAYAEVILHVVWEMPGAEGDAPPGGAPCLVLGPALPAEWRQLFDELRLNAWPYARRVPPGGCALKLAWRDDAVIARLLEAAGMARFHDKAGGLLREGLRQGFDQALYEAVFTALGYRANRGPMGRLAAAAPLTELAGLPGARHRLALLLGLAGFLPDRTRTPVLAEHQAAAEDWWRLWWQAGGRRADLEWVRTGQRPLNRPERRLLAGAALVERWGCRPVRWLDGLAAAATTPRALWRELVRGFTVQDERLAGFLTFDRRLRGHALLLGETRARDIVVNVALPFLAARARHQGDAALAERAEAACREAPRLQGNRRLTEVAHRLLVPPSRLGAVATTACRQQGLLEIYRDFCEALGHQCAACPLAAAESPPGREAAAG